MKNEKPKRLAIYAELGLAVAQHQKGFLTEAEAGYRKVIGRDPRNSDALNLLGMVRQQLGDLTGAEGFIRKALAIQENALFLANLANLLKTMGKLHDAEIAYQRALFLEPGFADAWNNLGTLLTEMQKFPEAEAAYRHALLVKPDDVDINVNFAVLLKKTKRMVEAEATYRRVLQRAPESSLALFNLGMLLTDTGRLADAEATYRQALDISPNDAKLYAALGGLLARLKRMAEAEIAYRRAIELQTRYPLAEFNLSLLLLTLGRYSEGWPLYELRLQVEGGKPHQSFRRPSFPEWKGESLVGKSLAVIGEQGYGDSIQLARYAALLKERGLSRLTFVTRTALKALLETVDYVDKVVIGSAPLAPHDYWIFMMSLPLRLKTTLETIPAALPYVRACAHRLSNSSCRIFSDDFKVGLVWKGSGTHKNDANRSLPNLATLAPLWAVSGVHFVSLQNEEAEVEALGTLAGQRIQLMGKAITDFADTAAIVSQLDLVICVDTAIAHLSGALGRPTWVLLPAVDTDWRWLTDRHDSPWYPGVMRLFRQQKPGDWSCTMNDVSAALKLLTETRRSL